jgi:hypothetical protein
VNEISEIDNKLREKHGRKSNIVLENMKFECVYLGRTEEYICMDS